jgi:hypothetical protein
MKLNKKMDCQWKEGRKESKKYLIRKENLTV